ncbi:uncharacterized protein J8A68_004427 [[Candida] subhashii]|uniref:E3 ubiquitin-protein ligase listerin n=1 Tax=[Candida] subhashii TaxID=561895 RepID=A0A8J5Q634_9ASCO|nr:uncharacterized protein J8A68_004427 [[Candida] subhashii]KAG7662039.1 hypothetical protein J8A68_004427 [[Candida] subhashii]
MATEEQELTGDLGYNGFSVSLNYFTSLPDITTIHSPELTVILKSLLKKDPKTKEKALTDLLSLLDNNKNDICNDLTIMAWIQIYPKLAIDNSRNTRSMAHLVQTKFLEIVGGKSYSKYLKSSIPVWLLGLFDPDRSVSNSTYSNLVQSFQGDRQKVDESVWIIFIEQIVNFIATIVIIETPETLSDKRYTNESEVGMKYERVLMGAVNMLMKIISLVNCEKLKLESSSIKIIERILNQDVVWEKLSSCVKEDTMNLALFKTVLTLILRIFDMKQDNKFITQLEDPNGLYKTISKKFMKTKLKQSSKSSVGSIVYSNVVLQFWSTIIVLTDFSQQAGSSGLKTKKNFWELAGNKAQSRFYEYLKIGHCNSDPSYYNIISSFFQVLFRLSKDNQDPESNLVDFSSDEEYKYITNLFLKQFNSNQGRFKPACLDCLFSITIYFQVDSTVKESTMEGVVIDVLKEISASRIKSISDDIVATIHKAGVSHEVFEKVNDDILEYITISTLKTSLELKVPEEKFIQSYFQLLQKLDLVKLIEHIVKETIVNLQQLFDPASAELPFKIISIYLDSTTTPIPELAEFISELPSYIEPDFVSQPINLLSTAVAKSIVEDPSEVINDVYLKLSMVKPTSINKFLETLKGVVKIDQTHFGDIYAHLLTISTKPEVSKSEIELLLGLTDSSEILTNVIGTAAKNETSRLDFIELCMTDGCADRLINGEGCSEIQLKKFLVSAWKNVESRSSCGEFLQFIKNEKQDVFIESLIEYLGEANIDDNFTQVSNIAKGTPISAALSERVKHIVNHMDIYSISMSNPLESAAYLCTARSTPEVFPIGPIFAKFLSELIQNSNVDIDEDIIVQAALIREYVSDYVFVQDSQKFDFEKVSNALSELESSISARLRIDFDTIASCINGTATSPVFTKLVELSNGNDTVAFYASRIIKKLIETSIEQESFQSFEAHNINYTKLVKTPLLFIGVISGLSKFLHSKTLDRIRNYVFSEILGVRKESDIISAGLKWVTFTILFLNFDDAEQRKDLFPVHKLTMALNQISSWFESSIAYDPEFTDVRIQAGRFLGLLAQHQATIPDNFWEVTNTILRDNLGMVGTSDRIDLKYYSLKVYGLLHRLEQQLLENYDEELLEIFLSDDNVSVGIENQASVLNQQVLSRALEQTKISTGNIIQEKEKLLSVFVETDLVPILRISSFYLRNIILRQQEDFVVDYQLQKSKLSEDEQEDDVIRAILPDELLRVARDSKYHTTHVEKEADIVKYLWSWYLIFTYFEDITFKMRGEYVSQITTDKNELNGLFEFIFEHIEQLSDKFFKTLITNDDIKTNTIPDYDLVELPKKEDLDYEIRFLCVHTYYKCLRYCGSQVQYWFKEIRDKQLKTKIEKLTSTYISPILITKILTQVTDQKDKIQNQEENMNIKINTITSEIKTSFVIDDQKMEMIIKIPKNYPLENVSVEGPLRLGVKETQWKSWLLASQRIISLTNGSIIESIELFCKNVKLHFSGFEDCAICYSILHSDLSLPSKTCSTCNNKFHAACLYKWFKSSGSSTCPLCRSAFNFRVSRS